MTKQVPFYLKKLRDEFEARASRRNGYSLRAYARFLGVEAPSLSSVLKGNRRLAKSKIEKVADRLNLSPHERVQFISSNLGKSTLPTDESPKREKLDPEVHFRIIAEWEHYAILSLIETRDFKPQSPWIAERLGISDLRARICIQNLLEARLIKMDGTTILLNQQGLETTEDVPSQAIRKARKQDLDQAMDAIEEVSVHLRDLSSCTMTVDINDLEDLKKMIRDFRRKFMSRAESKKGNEVYKLALQFFPMTNLGSQNETN